MRPRSRPSAACAVALAGVAAACGAHGETCACAKHRTREPIVIYADTFAPVDEAADGSVRADVASTLGTKDYVLPAVEIVVFEFLLNQYDRNFVDHHTYSSDEDSIRKNLHRGWVIDKDPFRMNQFAHPYGGTVYHGFARSSGLDYWEALAYDFAGSALWEVAGETDPPSLNDQITTTFAGSFLGEALFRSAHLVRAGGGRHPGTAREILATLIAPSAGFNRHVVGGVDERANRPDTDGPVWWWVGAGARRNAKLEDVGVIADVDRNHGAAAVYVDYGHPGAQGGAYRDPFDYFHLEATATSSGAAIPENIAVRGLLAGTPYTSGPDWRGIWGLYGTYDYFSPHIFKVSSTGVALGTTAQWLLSDDLALQGTATGGIGFTAAGTTADRSRDREYRYGASPQAALALRLVWSDVLSLDLTANDYLVTGGAGSPGTSGSENILRAQVGLTVRVWDRHAVQLQFVESSRDPDLSRQSVGAISLLYTYLGDTEFGVRR